MVRRDVIMEGIRKSGYTEGRVELGKQVLTYLENEYMSPKVERGTPYSQEILDLANHLGKLIRGEIK